MNTVAATPVTVITRLPGARETTLLNKLGAQDALNDTLVVLGEFGRVGLDHLLVIEAGIIWCWN